MLKFISSKHYYGENFEFLLVLHLAIKWGYKINIIPSFTNFLHFFNLSLYILNNLENFNSMQNKRLF